MRPQIQKLLLVGSTALALAAPAGAETAPVALSPGAASKAVEIESRCPTFSWGEVEGAAEYELVVYRLQAKDQESPPVLRQRLPGTVETYTPPLEDCLQRGSRYGWAVRALAPEWSGDWSDIRLFEVASAESLRQLEAGAIAPWRPSGDPPAIDARGTRSARVAEETASREGRASHEAEGAAVRTAVAPSTTPGPTLMTVSGNLAAQSFTGAFFGDGSGLTGVTAIYGDGSAGSLTVAATTDWSSSPPASSNFQFTDLTVNPGVTLTVPSGLTIRVTGTFDNAGTIVVQPYEAGGTTDLLNTTTNGRQATFGSPGAGVARRPAGFGERVLGADQSAWGGPGGIGVGNTVSASGILSPGPPGGGGGAGCLNGTLGTLTTTGGNGGGTLVVLARGALINTGTITADGATVWLGGGGGGGGVLVLASKTSVTNTGTINARGGGGGPSGVSNGVGGGGGGGIVQLVAPAAINTGTILVTGGQSGSLGAAGTVTAIASRQAGGGGGASGGDGGDGGAISGTNPSAGTAGSSGLVLVRTSVDPSALF